MWIFEFLQVSVKYNGRIIIYSINFNLKTKRLWFSLFKQLEPVVIELSKNEFLELFTRSWNPIWMFWWDKLWIATTSSSIHPMHHHYLKVVDTSSNKFMKIQNTACTDRPLMFANSIDSVVVRKLSLDTMSTKKSLGHSLSWKKITWTMLYALCCSVVWNRTNPDEGNE